MADRLATVDFVARCTVTCCKQSKSVNGDKLGQSSPFHGGQWYDDERGDDFDDEVDFDMPDVPDEERLGSSPF